MVKLFIYYPITMFGKKKTVGGFAEFLKEYNIVGMAVAFIMWAKVGELVASLVNDLIMPALLQPAMEKAGAESLAELSTNGIFWGKFLATAIDFLIVAVVVYLIITHLVKKFMPASEK